MATPGATPLAVAADDLQPTAIELGKPQTEEKPLEAEIVVDGRKALNPKKYGGFKGLTAAHTVPAAAQQKKAAIISSNAPVTHIDPVAVRCAEVPFGAWCAQKEKRVQTAFTRVVERDWYDKWEMTLRPVERAHLNAVREHYAMRRDKLKTPDIKARPKSNTLTRKGWAESMEALEVLNRETNVGTFFHGMVGRTMRKRANKEEKEREAAARIEAEQEARRAALAAATSTPL